MLSHSPPLAALYWRRSNWGACEGGPAAAAADPALWSEDTNSADCSLASSPLTRRCFDLPQSLIVPSYFCVNRHKRVASRCAFQFMLFPPDIHFVLLWGNASFRSHSTIYISDLNHHIWTTLWNIAVRSTTYSHDFYFTIYIKRSFYIFDLKHHIWTTMEHRSETHYW